MNSQPRASNSITKSTSGSSLADILERVLDKGIVIAGDITVSVGNVELLSVRIRLLVASVDKAREIGIDWWETDPYLSSRAHELMHTNQKLMEKVVALEQELIAMKQVSSSQAMRSNLPE
jgi:Gas vesicle protein